MEVDAFGQDFGGEEDVVFVGLFGEVSVEICLYKGHAFLAVRGIHNEDLGVAGLCQAPAQIVGGVLGFRENDELVALVVDFPVEKLASQARQKLGEFWVFLDFAPLLAEGVQLGEVTFQARQKFGFKVGGGNKPRWWGRWPGAARFRQ